MFLKLASYIEREMINPLTFHISGPGNAPICIYSCLVREDVCYHFYLSHFSHKLFINENQPIILCASLGDIIITAF